MMLEAQKVEDAVDNIYYPIGYMVSGDNEW